MTWELHEASFIPEWSRRRHWWIFANRAPSDFITGSEKYYVWGKQGVYCVLISRVSRYLCLTSCLAACLFSKGKKKTKRWNIRTRPVLIYCSSIIFFFPPHFNPGQICSASLNFHIQNPVASTALSLQPGTVAGRLRWQQKAVIVCGWHAIDPGFYNHILHYTSLPRLLPPP